ncbi:MAG: SH3 domain-containing protein, partial [Chloroflexi bacterium]|nr:SH3 domain-containing protein [Chloroflexota bacterium]
RVLVVAAPLLYVRAAPDRHARIVRRVHAGDRLRLLSTKSNWDYVAQRDGARGWVNARWVR